MTYAETARIYTEAGWPVPFPLPAGRKYPPPDGVTGAAGEDMTLEQAQSNLTPEHFGQEINYGLRMPEGVMGLDVDVYGDKHGDVVLAELEAKYGALPAGPWSSSRAWPSGIRFFRLPAGREITRLAGVAGPGIEVIQRHHRYAVVWPSVVDGREYEWQGWEHDGPGRPDVPPAAELPELPEAWVEFLAAGASAETGPAAAPEAVAELEVELFGRAGLCPEVASMLADADARMAEAAEGGRHDAMTALAFRLAHLCVAGHLSWTDATRTLDDLWLQYVGDARDRHAEFVRIMRTALGKVSGPVVNMDPCSLMGGFTGPISADHIDIPEGAPFCTCREPGVWLESCPAHGPFIEQQAPNRVQGAASSTIDVAGVQVFDPVDAYGDRALALAVLGHVGPGVRYLLDSGGWLHRGVEAWTVSNASLGEGARACVATAVRTLPHGRKDAEEGSTEHRRYQNRTILHSSAGLGRVASWISAEVASAGSPLGVRLSTLDAEPEILWAGGRAWDLRESGACPLWADLDPGTPHVRSAGVYPEMRETPLWDAFCRAVWPDPAQRAWALRVLGIAVTGYADRAMPILWGPRGRGKTQVLALVSDVLGSYAVAADPRLLGSGEHHGSVTLALAGARLAWIDEGPRSGHWATERLKALTGGGEMTGNPMRGNPVTFRPSHTLCLTSNDEPQVADEALRSRVRSIQCEGDLDDVRAARLAIGNLRGEPWASERPGVLAALMSEAAAWLADPRSSDNPLAVEAVLEALAREQDPVLAWLDERTTPAGWTPSGVLYEDFRRYCADSGIPLGKVATVNRWGRDLTAAGVEMRRGTNGVKLRERSLSGSGNGHPAGPAPRVSAFLANGGTPDQPAGDASGGAGDASGDTSGGSKSTVSLGEVNIGDSSDSISRDRSLTNNIEYSKTDTPSIDQAGGLDPYAYLRDHAGRPDADASSLGRHADRAAGPVAGEGVDAHLEGVRDVPRVCVEPGRIDADVQADVRDRPRAEVRVRGAEGAGVVLPSDGLPLVVLRGALGAEPQVHQSDLETASGLLGTLAGQRVTLDVEHAGYPIGHPDYALRTIQLGTEAFAVVLDAAYPKHLALAAWTLDAAAEIVGHAAQADVIPVALACGVYSWSWWAKTSDTNVLAALADPHLTGTDRGHALDLKGLAGRLLADPVSPAADKARSAHFRSHKWLTNTEPTTPAARSGWAQADYSDPTMARYAASDVLDTAALRAALPDVPPELLARERGVQTVTARIAEHGFRLDPHWIDDRGSAAEGRRDALRIKLSGMGVDEPGSTAKLGARLAEIGAALPKTPTGKPSTASDALEDLAQQDGPVQHLARTVLDWREQDKILGTYLEPYALLCEHGDGRVRPTVQTLGAAATGRMSVVRPNLQQVPKVGGIRGCVIADPGHVFVAADFASVEIRVAAALSGDVDLSGMIREGVDMHGRIAALVFGGGYTKTDRYAIKRVVFGKMYGSGRANLAKQLGEHAAQVDDVIDAMAQVMPGFVQWSARLQQEVRSGLRPVWRHPSGRLTYLPQDTPHKAGNYAIQSTARELLVDALERWEQIRPGHTLLPIHDEVLVSVREEEAEQASRDLVECMTTDLLGVPITAEAAPLSTRWADAV